MWQMVRSCDRSQRRLAAFLIIIVVLEVYAISRIIEHEHLGARADQHGGKKTTVSSAGVTKVAGQRNKSMLLGSTLIMANRLCPKENNMVARETKAHFSLGNDYSRKLSSYQSDFCVSNMQLYGTRGRPAPPPSAQILPQRVDEKQKWVSSTMRDFVSFGNDARTQCYKSSRGVFLATKCEHTSDAGILRDERTLQESTLSTYLKDFRDQPYIPYNIRMTKPQLKRIVDKRELNVSEARHSFQWPAKDRLKLPKHIASSLQA